MPRCALREMGPRLDLEVRRMRQATGDALKEALRQPKLGKKKEKNVGFEQLSGKVGRIYMPKQKLDTISLAKPKGVKRERREAAAAAAAAGKAAKAGKQSEAAAPEPSSGRPPRSKRQRTAGGEES